MRAEAITFSRLVTSVSPYRRIERRHGYRVLAEAEEGGKHPRPEAPADQGRVSSHPGRGLTEQNRRHGAVVVAKVAVKSVALFQRVSPRHEHSETSPMTVVNFR